jgi:hypothetical protein
MIMCDNCGDKSAVYFVNDSELCEDCFVSRRMRTAACVRGCF